MTQRLFIECSVPLHYTDAIRGGQSRVTGRAATTFTDQWSCWELTLSGNMSHLTQCIRNIVAPVSNEQKRLFRRYPALLTSAKSLKSECTVTHIHPTWSSQVSGAPWDLMASGCQLQQHNFHHYGSTRHLVDPNTKSFYIMSFCGIIFIFKMKSKGLCNLYWFIQLLSNRN